MAAQVRELIFDTSAVNKLRRDKDSRAILRSLGFVYHVGITGTVFSEVAATSDHGERKKLLNILSHLLASGSGLLPVNTIIENHAKSYQRDPGKYRWRRLNIHLRAVEDEIVRQEFIHDVSAETRKENKEWNGKFLQIFRNAEAAFQSLFVPGQTRPSLREVAENLMGPGGAHRQIGAGLVERATGIRPDEATIQDFIERCPPFRALLVALCFVQYDMCIRDKKLESLGKAGRNDMFSAVYLPYCKLFVTDDRGHNKAMKAVAELAAPECKILTYQEFTEALDGSLWQGELSNRVGQSADGSVEGRK